MLHGFNQMVKGVRFGLISTRFSIDENILENKTFNSGYQPKFLENTHPRTSDLYQLALFFYNSKTNSKGETAALPRWSDGK